MAVSYSIYIRKNEEQNEYHCEKVDLQVRKQLESAITATQASEVKLKILNKMMKRSKYKSDLAVKALVVFATFLEQNCIM